MRITDVKRGELAEAAFQASKNTYSPYSNYPVGAAILTTTGRMFIGTNVENASYGLTVCAERSAIFNAVSQNGSIKILAVAVYTGGIQPGYPCGACRQVINEFGHECEVIVAFRKEGEGTLTIQTLPFQTLLPQAFGPHNLA